MNRAEAQRTNSFWNLCGSHKLSPAMFAASDAQSCVLASILFSASAEAAQLCIGLATRLHSRRCARACYHALILGSAWGGRTFGPRVSASAIGTALCSSASMHSRAASTTRPKSALRSALDQLPKWALASRIWKRKRWPSNRVCVLIFIGYHRVRVG
jgi:hypothetical protein